MEDVSHSGADLYPRVCSCSMSLGCVCVGVDRFFDLEHLVNRSVGEITIPEARFKFMLHLCLYLRVVSMRFLNVSTEE